jgi:hypothetical protein
MTDVYSNRSNARRAAEALIAKGTSPATKYGLTALSTADGGGIRIDWQVEEPAAPEHAPQLQPEPAPQLQPAPVAPVAPQPATQLQKGDRVKVTKATLSNKKRIRLGTIDYQVDPDFYRVTLDGDGVSALVQRHQISLTDAEAPEPKPEAPAKAPRQPRAEPANPLAKAASETDATAAAGVMPEKPVIASKANPGYQKRVDFLAERAAAGDWKAVAAYEVKGVNTYAKMVVRYRDRLLAAHAAQS